MLVAWSGAFPAIQIALAAYSPAELAGGRLTIASVVLAPFAVWGLRGVSRSTVFGAAGLGLLGHAVYNVLLAEGEKTVAAGTAAFLVSLTPVFVLAVDWLLGDVSIGPATLVGFAAAVAGVALLVGPTFEAGGGAGVLLILATTAATSLFVVGQRRVVARMPFLAFVWVAVTAGAVALGPFVVSGVAKVAEAPLAATAAVVGLGLLSTATGYTLFAWVATRLSPDRLAAVLFGVPPVAAGLDWVVTGRVPGPVEWVGAGMILSGIALVRPAGPRKTIPASNE